ncbi:hypothetical protein HK102_012593 [Quaeritorhiza haematococci]|nr:hypothetical protein HK102_012593 [Quaeritorhiza haematococci]
MFFNAKSLLVSFVALSVLSSAAQASPVQNEGTVKIDKRAAIETMAGPLERRDCSACSTCLKNMEACAVTLLPFAIYCSSLSCPRS